MNKKGVELSINTVIILILAILTLVVVILIFSSSEKTFFTEIGTRLKSVFTLFDASKESLPKG